MPAVSSRLDTGRHSMSASMPWTVALPAFFVKRSDRAAVGRRAEALHDDIFVVHAERGHVGAQRVIEPGRLGADLVAPQRFRIVRFDAAGADIDARDIAAACIAFRDGSVGEQVVGDFVLDAEFRRHRIEGARRVRDHRLKDALGLELAGTVVRVLLLPAIAHARGDAQLVGDVEDRMGKGRQRRILQVAKDARAEAAIGWVRIGKAEHKSLHLVFRQVLAQHEPAQHDIQPVVEQARIQLQLLGHLIAAAGIDEVGDRNRRRI